LSDLVWTTIPGTAGVLHEGGGRPAPSISTRHMRQAEGGSSFSSVQRFGMSRMPLSTATLRAGCPSEALLRQAVTQKLNDGWPACVVALEGLPPWRRGHVFANGDSHTLPLLC